MSFISQGASRDGTQGASQADRGLSQSGDRPLAAGRPAALGEQGAGRHDGGEVVEGPGRVHGVRPLGCEGGEGGSEAGRGLEEGAEAAREAGGEAGGGLAEGGSEA